MILITQFVLSFIGALFGATWTENNSELMSTQPECEITNPPNYCNFRKAYYLDLDKGLVKEEGFPLIQKFGTWMIIFTNMVPISLMVTLEMVKLFQAIFMANDVLMYDEEQDMPMRALASNLNEELG